MQITRLTRAIALPSPFDLGRHSLLLCMCCLVLMNVFFYYFANIPLSPVNRLGGDFTNWTGLIEGAGQRMQSLPND